MKIAIPYQNGQVFPHFGHAPQFKFYTIESGMILHTEVVETAGSGHSAVTAFLMRGGVDTLICGSIGAGAQTAVAGANIRLYAGVSGDADKAVLALLARIRDEEGVPFIPSLMSQFTPFYKAAEHNLGRRITTYEYRKVIDEAVRLGLTDGYMQEKSSAREEYTPPFDLEGV